MFLRVGTHLRRLRTAWSLTLLTVASACGTATFIVQQYDGNALPDERIAIVRLNGDQPLRLEELDGEVLGYELRDPGARVHIEILPGVHELGLAEGAGLPLKRQRFRAEAGRVYRPMLVRTRLERAQPKGVDWSIAIYEVDRSSDEVLREVSQAPPPPHPPAVSPAPVPSLSPPPTFTPPASPTGTSSGPSGAAPTPTGAGTMAPASERLPSSVPPTTAGPSELAPPHYEYPPPHQRPSPVPSGVAPAVGPEPAAPAPAPASPL